MLLEERREGVDGVVDAGIRSESGLNLVKNDHRAVGSSALELA